MVKDSARERGGVTLEDFVIDVWAGVSADGREDCPVCKGHELSSRGCADCGARLS